MAAAPSRSNTPYNHLNCDDLSPQNITHIAESFLEREKFMVPHINLYQYAAENPSAPQVPEIMSLACHAKQVAPTISQTVQFFFLPSTPRDIQTQLTNIYTHIFTAKVHETHEYIAKRIQKLATTATITPKLAELLHQIHNSIVIAEQRDHFIFNVPFHFNTDYVRNLCKSLSLVISIPQANELLPHIKMLDTYKQMDYIQKHGIMKGNDDEYIGFVHDTNVRNKLAQYQKVRGTYNNTRDPINIANEEVFGNNNNNSIERHCDTTKLHPDEIMPQFIDPTQKYIKWSDQPAKEWLITELPYNRRQIVYLFGEDEARYRNCNRFFRVARNIFSKDETREGYKYNKLLNKYLTMVGANIKMLIPIRIVLPIDFEMGKHLPQKTITDQQFSGIISYNVSNMLRSYTKLIFVFKPKVDHYNLESGISYPFELYDYRFLTIPIGHLEHKKAVTYDELSTLSYMKVPIYELIQSPTDNRILFVHNPSIGEIPPEINSLLRRLNPSNIKDIMSTRFLTTVPGTRHVGGKRLKPSNSNIMSNLFEKIYTYKLMTHLEFRYLLYPYIYISNSQFSVFLTYKTPKYNNIYNISTIIKETNTISHEIITKFNIKQINQNVLEVNNYFPTSLTYLKKCSNTYNLLLFPNVKYHNLDKEKIQANTLKKYYKKYNTRIEQTLKVVKYPTKQDIIFFNLLSMTPYVSENSQIIDERNNLSIREFTLKFIKTNLNKNGTLILNLAVMNVLETRKFVLKLQKLFKTVQIYRPEIQHVFKQAGLALICKNYQSPLPSSKHTLKSLNLINNQYELDKEKFYYDLFPFYTNFVTSRQQPAIIKSQQKFQMLASYLYAKHWKLKLSIKSPAKRLLSKSYISAVLKDPPIKFDFKEMRRLYKKSTQIRTLSPYDIAIPSTKTTIWEKMRINREYAKLHNYKPKPSPALPTKNHHIFTIDKSSLQKIWKLFLTNPSITVHRPSNLSPPDAFYVITKGKPTPLPTPQPKMDKYFAIKMLELFTEMCHLYAFRLKKEVTLLKYKQTF